MLTSAPKSQKTSGGLSNLHINDWENREVLERVPYIWYSVTYKDQTEALLDLESKINVMS